MATVKMVTTKVNRLGKTMALENVSFEVNEKGEVDMPEELVQVALTCGYETIDGFKERKKSEKDAKKEQAEADAAKAKADEAKAKADAAAKEAQEAQEVAEKEQAEADEAKAEEADEAKAEEAGEEQAEVPEGNSADLLMNELDAMGLEELKEVAEEAKLPKNKWSRMKEDSLRAYLKEQLAAE